MYRDYVLLIPGTSTGYEYKSTRFPSGKRIGERRKNESKTTQHAYNKRLRRYETTAHYCTYRHVDPFRTALSIFWGKAHMEIVWDCY